jgi:hypothetical protein
MNITVIRADGSEERVQVNDRSEVAKLIDAHGCDGFNLRDGRRVIVDDNGHARGRPVNKKATALYHSICKPGTTFSIVGDVAIIDARDAR